MRGQGCLRFGIVLAVGTQLLISFQRRVQQLLANRRERWIEAERLLADLNHFVHGAQSELETFFGVFAQLLLDGQCRLGLLLFSLGFLLVVLGTLLGCLGVLLFRKDERGADERADADEDQDDSGGGNYRGVALGPFAGALGHSRSPGQDRLVFQEAVEVVGEFLGAVVAIGGGVCVCLVSA